jgi:predicted MPP superfamily phosphohydrolase
MFYLPVDIINASRWTLFKIKGLFNLGQDPEIIEGSVLITRSKFIKTTAIIAAAIPFLASLNGVLRNPYRYMVRRIKIPIKNLPASFEGFTITQLSDIHSGSLADKEAVAKGIQLANDLKSDVIFFTGDLVNDMTPEVDNYKDLFSTLKAPLGVYSVTGNHDYGDYVQWESKEAKAKNFRELVQTHKEMGWDILMNENRIIKRGEDSLAIIGIENWGGNLRFPKYGIMKEAYVGAENANVKLLLSHDPSHWDLEVRKDYKDIDVMFSGHTHGFQMGIETKYFKFSPSQWVYRQWAGLYQEGSQFIYVNRGFGFLGYPGRIGILPEITQIELVRG